MTRPRSGGCSATALPAVTAGRRRARRRIRRRSPSPRRAASAAAARPCATSISSRPRAIRQRSSTRSATATGWRRSSRAATRRRRSSATTRLRFDLRVVPAECYGNVLQHFTGSKDHNIALREDAQRRGLSISEYGVTTVETGEVVTHASEDELYAYLGYATIATRAARGNARDRSRARGSASGARRARRPARRDALPLDVVGRRQGLDRGDGAHREGSRLSLPLHHRPLALPPRRAARGAVGGDRRASTAV